MIQLESNSVSPLFLALVHTHPPPPFIHGGNRAGLRGLAQLPLPHAQLQPLWPMPSHGPESWPSVPRDATSQNTGAGGHSRGGDPAVLFPSGSEGRMPGAKDPLWSSPAAKGLCLCPCGFVELCAAHLEPSHGAASACNRLLFYENGAKGGRRKEDARTPLKRAPARTHPGDSPSLQHL